ncbi:MAG: FAD-binding oxidoreductase [Planctomycetes bacterium]|nr:FAD-binding oxidoreductase [Planctomycetota bacterium]
MSALGTAKTFVADDTAAVATFLGTRPARVRVRSGGSRQLRLPEPGDATVLDLSRLTAIVRLDGPDQTCTVECGLPRADLDAALATCGLELPCPGGGTLGGLFASDPIGASTFGGPSPRSLLLGMDAVLADGTPFKSGARVVKSVAGFDVHKLLVGSEGRLFVATRLHLRLKPAPRCVQWFCRTGLDVAAAIDCLRKLQQEPVPPAAVQLVRAPDGSCAVQGRFAGRAAFVAEMLRRHGLPESAPCWRDHLDPPTHGEVVGGATLVGALPVLSSHLPANASLLWQGGGRFEAALPDAISADAFLHTCANGGVSTLVVHGAPERRGHGTLRDDGHQRLQDGLRRALDPHGILV